MLFATTALQDGSKTGRILECLVKFEVKLYEKGSLIALFLY